jgi:hypothetical protein
VYRKGRFGTSWGRAAGGWIVPAVQPFIHYRDLGVVCAMPHLGIVHVYLGHTRCLQRVAGSVRARRCFQLMAAQCAHYCQIQYHTANVGCHKQITVCALLQTSQRTGFAGTTTCRTQHTPLKGIANAYPTPLRCKTAVAPKAPPVSATSPWSSKHRNSA